jgi:hypothetical protein
LGAADHTARRLAIAASIGNLAPMPKVKSQNQEPNGNHSASSCEVRSLAALLPKLLPGELRAPAALLKLEVNT